MCGTSFSKLIMLIGADSLHTHPTSSWERLHGGILCPGSH